MSYSAESQFDPLAFTEVSPEELAREQARQHRLFVARDEDPDRDSWQQGYAAPDLSRKILPVVQAIKANERRSPAGVIVLSHMVHQITGGERGMPHFMLAHHLYEGAEARPAEQSTLGRFAVIVADLVEGGWMDPTRTQTYFLQRTVWGANDKSGWPQTFATVLDDMLEQRPELNRKKVVDTFRGTLDALGGAAKRARGYTGE